MRPLLFVLGCSLALAACGGGDSSTSGEASHVVCAPPPPTVPAPVLPDGIPSPPAVIYTGVKSDAKQLTATGFAPGTLDEVVASYRSAFSDRSLLTLGKAETQGTHASMAVGGPSTKGSVTLDANGCGRVQVLLELRPLVGG